MAEPRMPYRRSPLFHRQPLAGEGGMVWIAEQLFGGKLVLRADPNEAVEPLRSALGLGLPFEPLTSATAGETSALWMGPDEWMLVTAPGEAAACEEKARAALAGVHHQLVDVSDYYTVIEVAGPKARDLLMKLTTLDVHPRAFGPGMVAGSMFGRAQALLWLPLGIDKEGTDDEAFRLFIRWSMADYLWCAIAEAGREWGVPEEGPVKGEKLTIA
jgi:heterotetrameric sarcosine oxidase gamma subunit